MDVRMQDARKRFGFALVFALVLVAFCTSVSVAVSSPNRAYADDQVCMLRIYNPNSGEHFYTSNVAEKDNLVSLGWVFEGIGWVAPTTGDDVYRLYNPNAGDHHYTLSVDERDWLVSLGWIYEGVMCQSGGNVTIYRQYNPNAVAGAHNFTPSLDEHNWLVGLGWVGEGSAWQAVDESATVYRLYNRNSGENFYTADNNEMTALRKAGWKYEGVAFVAPRSGAEVYRLYSTSAGVHRFVSDASERDTLTASGWTYEGVSWHSGGSVPVYRADSSTSTTSSELITTSADDFNAAVSQGWVDKGTMGYALMAGWKQNASDILSSLNIVYDFRSIFVHGSKTAPYQKYIMIHDTEGEGDPANVVNWWASNGNLVAAHFVIGKDGKVVQCGRLDDILHHAGYGDTGHNASFGVTDESRDDKRGTVPIGSWAADYGMNSYSIGIELVHVGGSGGYPTAQLEALDRVIEYIDTYYGFESQITDHKAWRSGNSDTSPEFATYLSNYQRTRSYKG